MKNNVYPYRVRVPTIALSLPLVGLMSHGSLAEAQAFSGAKGAIANYASAEFGPHQSRESPQTNTGYDAHKERGGSFVMSNPRKAVDYAYRAVNLTPTMAVEFKRSRHAQAWC
jgi:hypothetical protein